MSIHLIRNKLCVQIFSAKDSCILTICVPPLRKMVTALELWHSSMTSILSLVVPNCSSLTRPALPSLSGVSSWKRGTIRPPVAMAINYEEEEEKRGGIMI